MFSLHQQNTNIQPLLDTQDPYFTPAKQNYMALKNNLEKAFSQNQDKPVER